MRIFRPNRPVVLVVAGLLLAACGDVPVQAPEGSHYDQRQQRELERFGTVTGGTETGGLLSNVTRGGSDSAPEGGGGGIGVNAFLWRASLDTIDFMPLASADPFGGLIITDWYQPVDAAGERIKLHVLIADAALRADAVKVAVFRQVREGEAGWLDAPVDEATARELEDKILTRARELRIGQLEATG